jgi:transposase InsO family protein
MGPQELAAAAARRHPGGPLHRGVADGELVLAGAVRGKLTRITITDPQASRPADLVERQVTAQRPNALWVADLTYIRTWSGLVYAALVIDAFSRAIVGWQLAGPCAPTWPWTPWRWPSGSETPSSTDSSTPPLPRVATRQA